MRSLCSKHNLKICPVTFDQPLYQKAAEIVAASRDLDRVVVRLGGFHLLMSYLGSIGKIMTGSGLEDLWKRVYAKGSVVHMLTGHAFSRAVRAHILTLLALINVLIKSDLESQPDKEHLISLYQDTVDTGEGAAEIDKDERLQEFQQLLTHHLDQAATQSRTGKLWVQYIHQVLLMLHFIRTERTGDWKLHLHCVQMIPHFHAAGHLPYAKTARLYLQQMNSIEQVMASEEYKLFTAKGYFTIRRGSEFWSGNFSDQTIEQFLMRMLKTSPWRDDPWMRNNGQHLNQMADTSVNCDNAVQIGQAASSKITGKKFTEITLHRSDKVKTMGDHSSISVRGQHTEMKPTLFFNRITCVLKTSS
ncbi:hypothetical protein Pcinc_000394 [Petrolisthes cinctipes]|uniref:Uncharacterized protein n=1 Tax=Petrolisthes cinctipes TaxID=88211 RepID=A0AAE1GPU5_PETCI|nr:hypothetical protein Pcinc_000394 [Petrolisthes cinctipes]